MQPARAALVSTTRDGATAQLRTLRRRLEDRGGLSCEIARTFASLSLTTGTFNLVVKDRIAFRLSGANSVQANLHECKSDCPRNPTNIQCGGKPCQSTRSTEFPDDFHIGNSAKRGTRRAAGNESSLARPDSRGRLSPHVPLSSKQRATVWSSARMRMQTHA